MSEALQSSVISRQVAGLPAALRTGKAPGIQNTDSSNAAAYRISSTDCPGRCVGVRPRHCQIVKRTKWRWRRKSRYRRAVPGVKNRTLVLLACSLLLALGIGYWIITSVTRSIDEAKAAITAIGEGDLTVTLDSSSRDEIGDMMRVLQAMVTKLQEVIATSTRCGQHCRCQRTNVGFVGAGFTGCHRTGGFGRRVSASIEQMAPTYQQNTDNAQQTEKIALQAAEDIKEGSLAVNQTVESMKKIADKSPSSARLPGRPTCWPSTRPWKRPGPANTARALRW
jgi:methyl-accepting chemotaxis protein